MQEPLKLRVGDQADLNVVSALLQDALVPLGDISYLRDEQSFVLAVNRFRWEHGPAEDTQTPTERIHAGLRFDKVTQVQYRGIDHSDRRQFLALLSLTFESDGSQGDAGPGTVTLQFSGAGAIRLTVSELACVLSDFGEPWATRWMPSHDNT